MSVSTISDIPPTRSHVGAAPGGTNMTSIRCFLLATLAVVATNPLQAQSKPSPVTQVSKKMASELFVVIQHLRTLDNITETDGPVTFAGHSAPRLESTSLVMTWRVPELQVSKSMTNTLLGYPVPGWTVTTRPT